jgi:hypothetical protein
VTLVVALAIAAGFGSATYSHQNTTITTTKTLTSIYSGSVSSVQTVQANSSVCTIPVEGNLIMKVLNSSSGKPIESVPVQVENLPPSGCPRVKENLGTMITNDMGIITASGLGEFYFSITYFGNHYSVNASVLPVKATCITLGIPSGGLNISYSQPFQTSC